VQLHVWLSSSWKQIMHKPDQPKNVGDWDTQIDD